MSTLAARWLGSALGCGLALGLAAARAEAQAAPGATDTPADVTPAAAPTSESSDEQIILDPELAALALPTSAPPLAATAARASPSAQVRAVLHSRFAGDLHREDAREEVWESTTLATLDASIRRSERVRFALGMRARYRFATLADDVPDASAAQHMLDAVPTAGYADVTLAPGWHLQVGYQPVHLGRFDVFSATNFLAVSDLRDGPSSMPEGAAEVGQLAVLVDYDASSWLSLRAIYVPFFVSHIVSLTESDYALFPATQAGTDEAINGAAGTTMGASRRLRMLLRNNLSRDDRASIAQTGFAAFAPEPTFTSPQAALRLTAHGPDGEVAATLGTGLEHLPALALSQSFIDYAFESSIENEGYLAAAPRPVSMRHDRFLVASLDGATDLGPLTVGAELAYLGNRTLYALRAPGLAQGYPSPAHGDLAHLGLRAEYAASAEWLAALETFGDYALDAPSDGTCKRPRRLVDESTTFGECRYMFLSHGRFVAGAAVVTSVSPAALGLHFELSAAVITGPTLVLLPRIGYEPWDDLQLEFEIGALLIEGKKPSPAGTPEVAIGGAFDHVDQAFVGVRYQP